MNKYFLFTCIGLMFLCLSNQVTSMNFPGDLTNAERETKDACTTARNKMGGPGALPAGHTEELWVLDYSTLNRRKGTDIDVTGYRPNTSNTGSKWISSCSLCQRVYESWLVNKERAQK